MFQITKILCNSNSVLDVSFIVQKIRKLYFSKQSIANIVGNQIRLVQTTMGEITKSINNISDSLERFDRNIKLLQVKWL